jgi:hypothetical protein
VVVVLRVVRVVPVLRVVPLAAGRYAGGAKPMSSIMVNIRLISVL